ncbi:MAG: fimbrillin family protein, partial [Alistipes sp.]|nr:fimbrillin family protein [Alistipes sp.]
GACALPDNGLPVNLNVKHSLYDVGTILVLPQTIYKTDVTLHLEYKKQGDAEYAIRNIQLGRLASAAAPTEWKSGEKYEYNLTITDNTITTEVKVVDWVDHYVEL